MKQFIKFSGLCAAVLALVTFILQLASPAITGANIGGWGNEQVTYKFEGYKDGECVCTVVKEAVTSIHLEMTADADVLKAGDTYDATRVELVARDQNGNRLP